MAELSWETADEGDELHVTLTGELDISNVERFEQELMELEQPRPPLVVLDLRAVRFIDSTGLSLLLNADARARRQSRHVTIVSGNGAASASCARSRSIRSWTSRPTCRRSDAERP